MPRLTSTELELLEGRITEYIGQFHVTHLLNLETIALAVKYQGQLNGLSKVVRRLGYPVNKGLVTCTRLPEAWKPKPVDLDKENGQDFPALLKQLIKTVENQAKEIDQLRKENTQLQQLNKKLPTISAKVKQALAVYGD